MSNLIKFSLAFFLGMTIIACEKDTSNADSDQIEVSNFGNSGGTACLELIYPASFELPDSTVVTEESREDLKETIQAYKETNDVKRVRPSLVFPAQFLNSEGETIEVATSEELQALKEDCKGSRDSSSVRTKCLDLQFPLTYTLVDGTTVTGESFSEIKEAIKAWKEANPDTRPEAELVFPVEILNAEGELVTVEDAEALQLIKDECKDSQSRGGRGGRR